MRLWEKMAPQTMPMIFVLLAPLSPTNSLELTIQMPACATTPVPGEFKDQHECNPKDFVIFRATYRSRNCDRAASLLLGSHPQLYRAAAPLRHDQGEYSGFRVCLLLTPYFSYEDQGMSKDVEVKRVKEQWRGGVHRGGWGLSEELGLKTLTTFVGPVSCGQCFPRAKKCKADEITDKWRT